MRGASLAADLVISGASSSLKRARELRTTLPCSDASHACHAALIGLRLQDSNIMPPFPF
jgi:hypothetical protein